MDTATLWTIIGAAVAIIGFVYAFLRNLKEDLRVFKVDIKDQNEKFRSEIKDLFEKFKFEVKDQNEKFKFEVKDQNEKFRSEIKDLFEKFKLETKEQFERLEDRIDLLDKKVEKLNDTAIDIDRRLCRLEGAFTAKECCRIQDERHLKKAE